MEVGEMCFLRVISRRGLFLWALLSLFLILQPFVFFYAENFLEPNLMGTDDYAVVRTLASMRESSATSSLANSQRMFAHLRLQFFCRVIAVNNVCKNISLLPSLDGDLWNNWDCNGSSPRPNSDLALRI